MMEKTLASLLEIIQETKDFTLEQLPLVAKEIINFGIADSVITIVVCLGALLASYKSIRWGIREGTKEKYGFGPEHGLVCTIGSMTAAIAFLILVNSTTSLAKCVFAPRLYLIEKVSGLAKGGCNK